MEIKIAARGGKRKTLKEPIAGTRRASRRKFKVAKFPSRSNLVSLAEFKRKLGSATEDILFHRVRD